MSLRRFLLSLLATALFATALRGASESPSVVTVSAASYEPTGIAPDAIAATFGTALAPGTASGDDTDPSTPGVQLPTRLLDTRVEINGRAAQLLFVSPGQINFIVPSQTEHGVASVEVFNGNVAVAAGTVEATNVNPGIFTANSDGQGVAAALVFRVHADLSTQYEPIALFDYSINRYIARPIDLGGAGDRVFLVIFGTGLRHATDRNGDGNKAESVRVLLGGQVLEPVFAGSQGDFVGLDQINVEVPRDLIGCGDVSFALAVEEVPVSNDALVSIASSLGPGPLVLRFDDSPALAGESLTISGIGFSSETASNIVRIGGVAATVTSATPTELVVVVPFGVQSGNISVRTNIGETLSGGALLVRTSISGFVEDTLRQPLGGVTVKLIGSSISAQTNVEGAFVLPDVPTGTQYVEIDGETLTSYPPYPKVTLKTITLANRDNQFLRPVSLQQSNGASATVAGQGASSLPAGTPAADPGSSIIERDAAAPLSLLLNGFSMLMPANISAFFPDGARRGLLFMTPLTDGRSPVDFPKGVYSTSIVQITPFDVKLTPGAKLIFPNTDALPAGARAKLYRYDASAGAFVEDAVDAEVSVDGKRVETAANAITKTGYYFVAIPGVTVALSGRVLDRNGTAPASSATVSVRGQEVRCDGNGGYLFRSVPVKGREVVVVEAAIRRANGRIDRVKSVSVAAVPGVISKVPDIILPGSGN